jgi:hypothetical protein
VRHPACDALAVAWRRVRRVVCVDTKSPHSPDAWAPTQWTGACQTHGYDPIHRTNGEVFDSACDGCIDDNVVHQMIPHAHILRDFSSWFGEGQIDVDESLDLTAASLEEDDAVMERARLVTRGYAHGRTVRWIAEIDVIISISVYELTSALEAQLSVADHRETMRAAGAFTETASAVTVIARLQDDGDELALISQAHGPFHVTLLTRAAPQSVSTSTLLAISDAQSALLKPHAP